MSFVSPVDSSESSGESVSGFSSSSHSYHSAIGGEVEDVFSASVIPATEAAAAQRREASAASHKPSVHEGSPEKTQPPIAPKPKTKPQQPCGKVQYRSHNH